MKRTALVTTVLSFVLCAGLFVSSALAFEADPNLNSGGVEPICKERVHLKIGVPITPNIADWETNYMTKELERIGNYDLEFVYFTNHNEMVSKISMMMMNDHDNLPDIIITPDHFSTAQLSQWGDAGAIIPVNEYYADPNCSYYINDSMSTIELDNPLKYVTCPDGNVYGIYKLNMSLLNEHENRMFLYKPWLDALNLEIPTTVDELYNVLVAFRDKDPNGNGIADEIPMICDTKSLCFWNRTVSDFLMTPFEYCNYYSNANFCIDASGKLYASYATEGWRDGLRYLNKLMEEGLFSPLGLSMDRTQLKVLMSEQPTKVGFLAGTIADYFAADDPRRTEYYVLEPLEGPAGRVTSWSPSMPKISMIITSACKTPEAAFRFGDLMCSRYFSVMTRWGEKGVDWVDPLEGDTNLFGKLGYEAKIRVISPWGVEQNQWWAQNGPFIRDYSYGLSMVTISNPNDTQLRIADTFNSYIALDDPSKVIGSLVYDAKEQEIVNEYEEALMIYAKECFALFVSGAMDIEKDWDSYIAALNTTGLQELTAAKQSAYDRAQGK